ncbi:MAG: hypothetical protein LAT64_10655 [Phycisphaerales bacterium]|nr:hypothetical protein [Planctomycetota bacterium]MCH8509212.1 hypothetical protein [Phycisphaerales bacterium]
MAPPAPASRPSATAAVTVLVLATLRTAAGIVAVPEPAPAPFDDPGVFAGWTHPEQRFVALPRWFNTASPVELPGLSGNGPLTTPPAAARPPRDPHAGLIFAEEASRLARVWQMNHPGWTPVHARRDHAPADPTHLAAEYAPGHAGPHDLIPAWLRDGTDAHFAHAMLLARVTQLPAPGLPAACLACVALVARRCRREAHRGV